MSQESNAEDGEVFTGAKTFTDWPRLLIVLANGNLEVTTAKGRALSAFAVTAGMVIPMAIASSTANTTATLLALY